MQRMRDGTSFCDVVFVVQGERFPAHRCVVAAASPYFHALLTNGMKEKRQREITLKDVNVDAWRVILSYMYTAKIKFGYVDEVMQCLECANRFTMKELEEVIVPGIVDELDETTLPTVSPWQFESIVFHCKI